MVVTQNISVVGVKNDLVARAGERMYYTQNGSYADLPTLTHGTMNIARTSRDGYTYSVLPWEMRLPPPRHIPRRP